MEVDCETGTMVYEGGLDKRSSLDSVQQAQIRSDPMRAQNRSLTSLSSFSTVNVRIGPELHRNALIAAKERNLNLNEFVKRSIEQAVK